MFQQVQEGFRWIESYTNLEKQADQVKRYYRLDRMKALLKAFGDPQKQFKSIHLAGSKGKGSTAVLTASALEEAGHKTGLYTSPHLTCYQERIRVNRKILNDQVYLENLNRIHSGFQPDQEKPALPGGEDPTTFELLTLLGFLIFADQGCDWAVVETGLGGRLDATNVLNPSITIITPIEMEHTNWLGDTIEKIAAEKAGIIKSGIPVVLSGQSKDVFNVIKTAAEEKNAFLLSSESEISIQNIKTDRKGSRGTFYLAGEKELPVSLKLIGTVQLKNAASAFIALKTLFPEVPLEIWAKGFSKAFLPGRMQIIQTDPLLIIDGSHTPRSFRLAVEDFLLLTEGDDPLLLFACGDDKDAKAMAEIAAPFSDIMITSPGFFKKSHPELIARIFEEVCSSVQFDPQPSPALEKLRSSHPYSPIMVSGSFFLAGEILKELEEKQGDFK